MIKIYYTRWPKSNNKDFDINWSDPEVDKKKEYDSRWLNSMQYCSYTTLEECGCHTNKS